MSGKLGSGNPKYSSTVRERAEDRLHEMHPMSDQDTKLESRLLVHVRELVVVLMLGLGASLASGFIERYVDPISQVSFRGFPATVVIVEPANNGEREWKVPPIAFAINLAIWLVPVASGRALLARRARIRRPGQR